MKKYNCAGDCSGWVEEYSYSAGLPEGKLAAWIAKGESDPCPYCGGEVYCEAIDIEVSAMDTEELKAAATASHGAEGEGK